MKWTSKPEPKVGDEKTVRFFAWLPIWIGNETRWLEMVTVHYVFGRKHQLRTMHVSEMQKSGKIPAPHTEQVLVRVHEWEPVRFVD